MDYRLKGILIGFVAGLIVTVIGSEVYLRLFTHFDLVNDFSFIYRTKLLGRITAIGSLFNLALFTFFITKRRDFYARGCILAVFFITLITFFI
ncbi:MULTISPECIES: hypothetical protein [Myroides]|uniref:Uncharacterized protein n=1 Tax=Myroides albus TaxID=2562892 RepID=A0A6I3LFN3_9FLAO|nr:MULTISPECIES: hypothetical protein [Myroides]MTG96973.1 hypothetical protein [Myroides albus]MVX35793.1 hypothetical protein [Myroides sp. LoEW2-1]UVD78275.1 hypothetical protein NWE55_09010 [Myroides albus]